MKMSVVAKALAKNRKPAQMDEERDYKAEIDSDRRDDLSEEERGELAAAQAINNSREDANKYFQSAGKMQNDEYNRSTKAEAMARAKKAKQK